MLRRGEFDCPYTFYNLPTMDFLHARRSPFFFSLLQCTKDYNKNGLQPTTSTALPKSGISFFWNVMITCSSFEPSWPEAGFGGAVRRWRTTSTDRSGSGDLPNKQIFAFWPEGWDVKNSNCGHSCPACHLAEPAINAAKTEAPTRKPPFLWLFSSLRLLPPWQQAPSHSWC